MSGKLSIWSNNEAPRPFPIGDNYEIAKYIDRIFKNVLLQNHWANFKQNWHEASFSEKDSSLPNEVHHPFPNIFIRNSENTLTTFNNLLQNHWANFKPTWHKTLFCEGKIRFYK